MKDFERNLNNLMLTPYIIKATALIGVKRKVGGNIFRHQMATFSILIDYKYSNSVLLKASVIHDLIEDFPSTNLSELESIDSEAKDVVKLVLEVSRKQGELKIDYLKRILETGSLNAKLLKVADRISNLIDMNSDIYTSKRIEDYLDQTETYVLPLAKEVDKNMVDELTDLINKRRALRQKYGFKNLCIFAFETCKISVQNIRNYTIIPKIKKSLRLNALNAEIHPN